MKSKKRNEKRTVHGWWRKHFANHFPDYALLSFFGLCLASCAIVLMPLLRDYSLLQSIIILPIIFVTLSCFAGLWWRWDWSLFVLLDLIPQIAFVVWGIMFLLNQLAPQQNMATFNYAALSVWLIYFIFGCLVALRRGVNAPLRKRKANL